MPAFVVGRRTQAQSFEPGQCADLRLPEGRRRLRPRLRQKVEPDRAVREPSHIEPAAREDVVSAGELDEARTEEVAREEE